MRTEVRQVIEEFYIADDGTEFDNEGDCIKYEFNKKVQGSLIFYDGSMEETNEIWECRFVDLPTEEDVKRFKYLLDSDWHNVDGLEEPGAYMWLDDECCWMNLDWIINQIRGGAKNEN